MRDGPLFYFYFLILSIYLFFLPQFYLEGQNVIAYNILYYTLLGISVLQIFLLVVLTNFKKSTFNNSYKFWLIIFLVLSALSYFWSEAVKPIDNLIYIFKILILIIPILFTKFNILHIERFFKVYCIGTFCGSVQVIYNYYFNAEYIDGLKRSFITGIDSNESSILLALGLTISLFYYLRNKKIFFLIIVLINIIGVVYTGSRTGFVVSLVSIIIMLKHFKLLKINLTWLITLIIFAVLTTFLPQGNLQRIIRFSQGSSGLDLSGRPIIWAQAMKLIPEKLMYGFGMHSFSDILAKGFEKWDAHNVFLKVQVELGLIGTLALLIFTINIFKKVFINNSIFKPVLICCIVIIYLSFLQLSWIYSLNLLTFLAVILNTIGLDNIDIPNTSKS